MRMLLRKAEEIRVARPHEPAYQEFTTYWIADWLAKRYNGTVTIMQPVGESYLVPIRLAIEIPILSYFGMRFVINAEEDFVRVYPRLAYFSLKLEDTEILSLTSEKLGTSVKYGAVTSWEDAVKHAKNEAERFVQKYQNAILPVIDKMVDLYEMAREFHKQLIAKINRDLAIGVESSLLHYLVSSGKALELRYVRLNYGGVTWKDKGNVLKDRHTCEFSLSLTRGGEGVQFAVVILFVIPLRNLNEAHVKITAKCAPSGSQSAEEPKWESKTFNLTPPYSSANTSEVVNDIIDFLRSNAIRIFTDSIKETAAYRQREEHEQNLKHGEMPVSPREIAYHICLSLLLYIYIRLKWKCSSMFGGVLSLSLPSWNVVEVEGEQNTYQSVSVGKWEGEWTSDERTQTVDLEFSEITVVVKFAESAPVNVLERVVVREQHSMRDLVVFEGRIPIRSLAEIPKLISQLLRNFEELDARNAFLSSYIISHCYSVAKQNTMGGELTV